MHQDVVLPTRITNDLDAQIEAQDAGQVYVPPAWMEGGVWISKECRCGRPRLQMGWPKLEQLVLDAAGRGETLIYL